MAWPCAWSGSRPRVRFHFGLRSNVLYPFLGNNPVRQPETAAGLVDARERETLRSPHKWNVGGHALLVLAKPFAEA